MAEIFPSKIKNREMIARILLLLLVGSILFGSLIRTGSIGFSTGNSAWQTIIPLSILIYLIVISLLTLIGIKLDKMDFVIIPTIGTVLILLFINSLVQPHYTLPDDLEGVSTTATDEVDLSSTTELSETPSSTTVGLSTIIPSQQIEEAKDSIDMEKIVLFSFISVILAIVLLFLYSKFSGERINVTLLERDMYNKPQSDRQLSIYEIYVKCSNQIESTYGRAPRWYSPTHFSEVIEDKSVQALASYFFILTNLYEKARFANTEITLEDVREAEELEHQINLTLQQIIEDQGLKVKK